MQCRCPISFYFGSENDYLNLENISTNGPLNSRQGRDHFIGLSACGGRGSPHCILKHLFLKILFLEIISVESESINHEEKNVSIEKTYPA